MMLYISFFLTVTLLVLTLFAFRTERASKIKRRLSILATQGETNSPDEEDEENNEPSALRKLVRALWGRLRRKFSRRIPEEQEARMELKLLQAGRPFGMGPFEFRILQFSLLIAFPLLFASYCFLLDTGAGGILLALLFGLLIGKSLPSYYIGIKIKRRSRMALRELPDVLDLLTVSLEAGLGFDAALSKLVSKAEGVLSIEFHRCLEEIRLGKTRREALIGVRDRIALDEIRVVISSILQAERLGIGMVHVLRVQSQEVREQRKQRAEEAAMKAPVKMLFPLVLFIFPSLFIVLLGPAVIQFLAAF